MKPLDFFVLLLALSWVWDIITDRPAFAAEIGRNRLKALTLAATIWLLAVMVVSGSPLLLVPCLIVFALAVWQAARRVWAAGQALFGRKRKVA
ncbi:hypothetical protein Q8W71_00620 [Methylobacterium sp. NEAU 140]|uniref:hypothetical protein n=1 Tax=Methylobacterium sp. NEAU 140 TaxID=3064945 RepID=UPI0027349F1D|nr:hypothetical protein [Methylobacterium sp. NEAU 140]MDP4021113.1 hypothetical protein [Methylobacterium sp. NEAU 140]